MSVDSEDPIVDQDPSDETIAGPNGPNVDEARNTFGKIGVFLVVLIEDKTSSLWW